MRYTIELTEAEREVICNVIRTVRDNSLGEHRLFENTTIFKFDEESTDYSVAYLRGIEDGKKKAIDENTKDHQGCYNSGLEDGYKGYKYLEQWFNDTCFYDDEDNLFPEYKRRQADTCCLEDIITDVGFSEVLNRVKAHEEKKKAEKKIKVGDIVYYGEEMLKAVVLDIFTEQGITVAVMLNENGLNVNEELSGLKFIEHTNEVEQLLDKLRGE